MSTSTLGQARSEPSQDCPCVLEGSSTLFLAPELFEREGGVQRILQLYLKALCDLAGQAGKVRSVVLNDGVMDSIELRRSSNERLVEWHVCGGDRWRFVRETLARARISDRLVCGHVGQAPVALLAKAFNPRLRYYVVAHGIDVWARLPWLKRLALRRAARILCVSDYSRRELVRLSGIPEGRTAVLHNALYPSFEIGPGLHSSGAPVILAVTRITRADREKGVDHLIQALPAIRAAHPGTVLRVIGRGDDLGRLIDLSRQIGVADAVEFLGYVSDRRLVSELRACSLFALPSRKEGFGLVFVEAMAHGRPCVGARAGGIPEIITPETGLLVDYGDVPGLAAACISGLERAWNESAILARAAEFSYPVFRAKLASLLVDRVGAATA